MYYSILPRLAQGPHGCFLPAPQVAAVPPTLWSEEGGPPTAERVYPFVKMGVPFAAERVYPFRRKGSTLPDAGGLPLQQQGVYPFAKKSGELGSKEWGVLVKRVGRLGQRCGEHRSTRRQGCNEVLSTLFWVERVPCFRLKECPLSGQKSILFGPQPSGTLVWCHGDSRHRPHGIRSPAT